MALQQSRCHGAAAWTASPLGAGPGGGPASALDSDATEVAEPAQHLDKQPGHSGCLHRIRKVQANFQVTEVRRSMAIPFKMPFDVTGS